MKDSGARWPIARSSTTGVSTKEDSCSSIFNSLSTSTAVASTAHLAVTLMVCCVLCARVPLARARQLLPSAQTFAQLSPRPVVLEHQQPVSVRPPLQVAVGPSSSDLLAYRHQQ